MWFLAIAVAGIAAMSVVGVSALLANPAPQARAQQPIPTFTFASQTPTPQPGLAPLPVSRQPDGRVRVLFTGDSLTGAYFATTEAQGFRQLVIDALGPVDVTTATKAHQDLSTVSGVTTVPDNLDLAVIELGTNDVGIPTPLDDFRDQYDLLVAKVRASSPTGAIICAGTWTSNGAAYDDAIRASCEAAGGRYVALAPLFSAAGNRGPAGEATFLGDSDDFHPNDAGHRAIADLLLAQLTF